MQRKIEHIVYHCTGTARPTTIQAVFRFWRDDRKWKSAGYHLIIQEDGSVFIITPIDQVSNGVHGHNSASINIAWVGGVNGIDNRTERQKATLKSVAVLMRACFPEAEHKGHNEFPGVTKACPAFDVEELRRYIASQILLFNP